MDLSLLPTPVSEHKKQSAGALFTVRTANSPSSGLSRKGGVRKTSGLLEEGGERTGGAVGRGGHGARVDAAANKEENHTFAGYQSGWQGSVKGQRGANNTSYHIMSTRLNQPGPADKTKTELDIDGRVNSRPSSERRGRAEWRRHDLPSRSQSLDFRMGRRSPDRDKSHNLFVFPPVRGEVIGKQVGTEWDCERGRVRSSVQLFNSAGATNNDTSQLSHHGQALNRGDRGNSLPSRWRSQSGPGSDIRGMATTPGPKGSQSILERIEKLYGSAGFSKTEDYGRIRDSSKSILSHHKDTAMDFNVSPQQRSREWATGGTFPRRFSSESAHSPGRSSTSFTWTQDDTPERSLSPETTRYGDKLSRGQWQGQTEDSFSEDRGLDRGGALESFGTMSLDRVRSRNSIAAQLRSARAAGDIRTPQNTSLQEEESPSWRDSLRLSERRGAGSKVKVENVESDEVNSTPRGRVGGFKEGEEEKKTVALKCSADEDVFELHPQKTTTKASERKIVPEIMSVSSADSVKNRIHQFEALTQRFQDVAPGQSLPRRTFSVPSQVSRAQGGVKKSWSAKTLGELRDRSGGSKEAGGAKDTFSKGKAGSERSLSVDEVGLRLEERERNDLNHVGNNSTEDFQKYPRLEVPPTKANQEPHEVFSMDETDFTKTSSPDEERKRPTYLPLSICVDTGGQHASPSPTEDKTPSNTPTNSPHLSPTTQPENVTVPHRQTEAASRGSSKSHKQPPLFGGPPATSPNIGNPDVNASLPRRGKQSVVDMDAWLSSLNTEIHVWNDRDEDDDDNDDESTQKDEDSNYDSDSGESSVTITSNMSQSEQRSFSVRWVAAQLRRRTSSLSRTLTPSSPQPFRPVQLRWSRLRVGERRRRRRVAGEHPAIGLAQLRHVGLFVHLRAAQRGAGQAAGGRQEPGRRQPAGVGAARKIDARCAVFTPVALKKILLRLRRTTMRCRWWFSTRRWGWDWASAWQEA